MALAKEIAHKEKAFKGFLHAAGAEVLITTNEWELVRFRTGSGTSILYRNGKGMVTFTGEAEKAWTCFKSQASWRPKLPTESGERAHRPKKSSPIFRTLIERDGDLCFFCWKAVEEKDASIEHLVNVSHGGPSHMSNMFLAHKLCNSRAGNLSAPEKIRIHVNNALALEAKWSKYDARKEARGERPVLEGPPHVLVG